MQYKRRVIALGFFDGIHLGHSALMSKVLEVGTNNDLLPSVITFDIHPHNLITGTVIPLINSLEDRTGLINRIFCIDDIIYLHFDKVTADIPWHEFIDHLVHEFGARHLIAGNDFRFGSGGKGNSALLEEKCKELGIGCDIIDDIIIDGVKCSSTFIRDLISAGDMERANKYLGHQHVMTDVVRVGFRLGRTLGTPTINMCFQNDVLIPAFGVYATKAYPEDGGEYLGVTNIGIRPTVDKGSGQITAETHILDFRGNLYGRKVRIEFYKHLRPEIKFNGTDELKAQIQRDCDQVQAYFVG